ncbi:hypothetical protein Q31b_19890 [Novipirellula aureliae]|uniref:Uncharacterized protein n=1 Tax=Novipirellula aureliae TaxID=2527966 RepID=A0A5C6E2L0_9BACT|nr:hypothetical protein Q31b_19890 [Novipirellula aureliae]
MKSDPVKTRYTLKTRLRVGAKEHLNERGRTMGRRIQSVEGVRLKIQYERHTSNRVLIARVSTLRCFIRRYLETYGFPAFVALRSARNAPSAC